MGRLLASVLVLFLVACSGGTDDAPAEISTPEPDRVTETESADLPAEPMDATGASCGGISGVICPSGYYCQQPDGQCLEIMDGTGSCQPVPDVCTREYRPVCGCDGQTYSNACEAAAAGASVAAEGECASVDTL